jgi:hypothetical protein
MSTLSPAPTAAHPVDPATAPQRGTVVIGAARQAEAH